MDKVEVYTNGIYQITYEMNLQAKNKYVQNKKTKLFKFHFIKKDYFFKHDNWHIFIYEKISDIGS